MKNSDFKETDPTTKEPLPNTVYSRVKTDVLVDYIQVAEVPKAEEQMVTSSETIEQAPVEDTTPTETPSETTTSDTSNQQEVMAQHFDLVHFEYDKYNVSNEFRQMLTDALNKYDNTGELKILIEGHADERGSNEYNLNLGEKRARAVKDVLVGMGVPAENINTISYGEENPVDYGKSEAAYSKNRRAVVIVK